MHRAYCFLPGKQYNKIRKLLMNPGRLRYEKANSFPCFVHCTGVFFDSNFSHGGDGDNLIWKLYTDGELVIEGTGAMENYSYYFPAPWYASYGSSIKNVTIMQGVTSIGERAFYNCSSLTSIEIPESVTSIDEYAFSGCSSLTSIEISEGVINIGDQAFAYCRSLTSVVIPEGVTSIAASTFSGCSGLTSILFAGNAPTIGGDCFDAVTGNAYYPKNDAASTAVGRGQRRRIQDQRHHPAGRRL